MSMFDTISPLSPRTLGGTTLRLLDADTVIDDSTGERYRLSGVDAQEVDKIIQGQFKPGDAGGEAATDAVYELMNNNGYINAKPILDENGEIQMDDGGSRIIAEFTNDSGESFTDKALYEGIFNPSERTNAEQDLIASIGQSQRDKDFLYAGEDEAVDPDDWDKARGQIEEALANEGFKQFGLKRIAANEAELAQANEAGVGAYYNQNMVETRSTDRTLNNEALNPWSDSWDKSMISVAEAASGIKNMFGELTDNEYIAEAGRLGVQRNRNELSKYGTSIQDWKDVDSFSDGIDYVVNNTMMSIPYIAIAGASALAAPLVGTAAGALGAGAGISSLVTTAAALSAPSAVYAAQTWNEMEGKKNMAVAATSGILQGALDRIGLQFIFKGGTATKVLLNEAVDNLVKNGLKIAGQPIRQVSREEAKNIVGAATRRSLIDFTADAAKAAKGQLAKKQIIKRLATRAGKGGFGELGTEALQELTAYTSASLGSDKTFDWNEATDRMISGAIAGYTLGTTLSVPGAIYDLGAWTDLAVRKAPAEAKRLSEAGARVERKRAENGQRAVDAEIDRLTRIFEREKGYTPNRSQIENLAEQAREPGSRMQTVDEILAEERQRVEATKNNSSGDQTTRVNNQTVPVTRSAFTSLEQRSNDHDAVEKDTSLGGYVGRAMKGAKKFLIKSSSVMDQRLRDQSGAIDMLGALFGSNLEMSFSGRDFESAKIDRVSQYSNMVDDPRNFYSIMNNGNISNADKKIEVSDKVYDLLYEATSETGKFDENKIPLDTPDGWSGLNYDRNAIIKLGQDLEGLSDKMWRNQRQYNPNLGRIDGYLFRFKTLNKASVSANRSDFEAKLVEEYSELGMTPAKAKDLTDKILENSEINTIDDAAAENFDVTKGGIIPGSHRTRSLGMSENDAFKDYMERDIFANVASAAKSAARFEMHRKYIGENGEIIASLLDQAQFDDGVDKKEVDRIASEIKDYLNAESGNYKRPTTDEGKKLVALQKGLMFLATFSMLGLATVSSIVEIALSGRALTADQIYRRKGAKSKDTSLESFGSELAKVLADLMGFTSDTVRWKDPGLGNESKGQQIIRDLGYYDWDVGAATVTGVSETNPLHQRYYELFFKMTGLTGWTNFTRAMRGSIAADFMYDHIGKIIEFRKKKRANPKLQKDNDVQESEEMLRNLGVNVDDMVTLQEKLGSNLFDNPNQSQLTPKETEVMLENMRTGTFNFINDAVALPTVGNRPLIYQDPRFALLTQFQGFIATFSANHIPKMYRQYIRRGNPSMKYNAFALMTTMIMLGFASQYLKDLIKFAGSDKEMLTAGNPYLDTGEYVQRGIRASGLLGVTERLLDTAGFGLYDDGRSKNMLDWTWKTVSGEAPAAGIINRGVRIGSKLIDGEIAEAGQQASKFLPGLGVAGGASRLGDIGSAVSDALPNWNFKGDD